MIAGLLAPGGCAGGEPLASRQQSVGAHKASPDQPPCEFALPGTARAQGGPGLSTAPQGLISLSSETQVEDAPRRRLLLPVRSQGRSSYCFGLGWVSLAGQWPSCPGTRGQKCVPVPSGYKEGAGLPVWGSGYRRQDSARQCMDEGVTGRPRGLEVWRGVDCSGARK